MLEKVFVKTKKISEKCIWENVKYVIRHDKIILIKILRLRPSLIFVFAWQLDYGAGLAYLKYLQHHRHNEIDYLIPQQRLYL